MVDTTLVEIIDLTERDAAEVDPTGELGRTPTGTVLLVPDDDEPSPLVSIVVPALNEELTID